MIYWFIILTSAGYAILHLFKIRNKFALSITIIQIVGVIFSLLGNLQIANLIDLGWIVYLSSLFMCLYYASRMESDKRLQIILITTPLILTNLFQFLHFPGAGWLGILCIISIFCYFQVLKNYSLYMNEFGFLTIMVADALIILLLRVFWLAQKF